MSILKWIENNTVTLKNKTVVISGATGGLGTQICKYLLMLNANVILLDRNIQKSQSLKDQLLKFYPRANIKNVTADMGNFDSVKKACDLLEKDDINIFIHNAGAYLLPKEKASTGYLNSFQINFISPYYITKRLLPVLNKNKGRVVAVSSIAHNYSKADFNDIDFSSRKSSAQIYGNAKRFLMFSFFELFKNQTNISLSIVHPGITFTNITAHYPKFIFAVIKHPMKIIFMKPKYAALSVIKGVFCSTPYFHWIGPRFFDIWGMPKSKRIKTCSKEESEKIFKTAEKIYNNIKD